MTDLAEKLDGIRVHVQAPGTDIEAELRDRTGTISGLGKIIDLQVDPSNRDHVFAVLNSRTLSWKEVAGTFLLARTRVSTAT